MWSCDEEKKEDEGEDGFDKKAEEVNLFSHEN